MRDEFLRCDCVSRFFCLYVINTSMHIHMHTSLMCKNKSHVSFVHIFYYYEGSFSVSALCWIILMCAAQYRGAQSSVWRSRPSFKWGPEGTESWTAGHIQREFPHIMGSNTRCRENRGCLLCWLTLHPLTPRRMDIDCVWSVPASEHPAVWSRNRETTHALWRSGF